MPLLSCCFCRQVKEVAAEHHAAQWADEFDAQPAAANVWASEFRSQQQVQPPAGAAWATEFGAQAQRLPAFAAAASAEADTATGRQEWAAEFGREHVAEGIERWADDFAKDVAGGGRLDARPPGANCSPGLHWAGCQCFGGWVS